MVLVTVRARAQREAASRLAAAHLRAAFSVRGKALLLSGQPAPSAIVTLDSDHRLTAMAIEPDGHFDQGGVTCAARTCWISATFPPDLVAGPMEVRAATGEITLALAPSATVLSGHVTDDRGGPLRAEIRLIDAQGSHVRVQTDGTGTYSVGFTPGRFNGAVVACEEPVARGVRSDGDGFYRLDGLAPGHLVVRCEADGYAPATVQRDVVGGTVTALAFTMQPGSPAAGATRDE